MELQLHVLKLGNIVNLAVIQMQTIGVDNVVYHYEQPFFELNKKIELFTIFIHHRYDVERPTIINVHMVPTRRS